jgi:hypothetical protein
VKTFLTSGVPCVSTSYFIDWVAHPWQPLTPHFLFGTEPTEKLALLEAQRGKSVVAPHAA